MDFIAVFASVFAEKHPVDAAGDRYKIAYPFARHCLVLPTSSGIPKNLLPEDIGQPPKAVLEHPCRKTTRPLAFLGDWYICERPSMFTIVGFNPASERSVEGVGAGFGTGAGAGFGTGTGAGFGTGVVCTRRTKVYGGVDLMITSTSSPLVYVFFPGMIGFTT
jgi:hypothetical protein